MPNSFHIQGGIYHNIGPLLPQSASHQPAFQQLYIYNTENELQNRLNIGSDLDQSILTIIQNELHEINHYIVLFKLLLK